MFKIHLPTNISRISRNITNMSEVVIPSFMGVHQVADEAESWFVRISPEDRIYLTRIIFAIVAASICIGFNLSGILGIVGFILGIALIVISYFIPIKLLGVDLELIGGHARAIMKGLGTAILLFLVIWLLVGNFIYAATYIEP